MLLNSGVYTIRNVINGKIYIGSTVNKRGFGGRFTEHKKALRLGAHHSRHLQKAWDKYGAVAFMFQIIERCSRDQALLREQYWIDHHVSSNSKYGYNICPLAGNSFGYRHTLETKAKLSALRSGVKLSQAHKDAIGAALRGRPGRPHSPETRLKISRRGQGKDMRKQTAAAALAVRGKPFSESHRANIGSAVRLAALKRRSGKIDEVTRLRESGMSLSNIGKAVGVSTQTVLNWLRDRGLT